MKKIKEYKYTQFDSGMRKIILDKIKKRRTNQIQINNVDIKNIIRELKSMDNKDEGSIFYYVCQHFYIENGYFYYLPSAKDINVQRCLINDDLSYDVELSYDNLFPSIHNDEFIDIISSSPFIIDYRKEVYLLWEALKQIQIDSKLPHGLYKLSFNLPSDFSELLITTEDPRFEPFRISLHEDMFFTDVDFSWIYSALWEMLYNFIEEKKEKKDAMFNEFHIFFKNKFIEYVNTRVNDTYEKFARQDFRKFNKYGDLI